MNKEIDFAGKKIVYRVYGNGKPVMLVHGFGETGDVWQTQVDFLKDSFQLIVPDLPGSGQSEMIDDMSIEGMAEVVKTILEAEAAKKVAMIGHSMGGYITLAFAEKYPGYLNSFGLFHSTTFADTEEKKAARRKGIEFTREHGAYDFLKSTIPNLFSEQSKSTMRSAVEHLIAKGKYFRPEAIIAYYEAMISRPDRTAILKNTKLPVLFIIGENDITIPMQDMLKQSHLPGKSFIHILHQSAHLGMLEEPEKANTALKEFLSFPD
jgi:pimeloyl-ACP methyl ester carboxylesterase